MANIWDFDTINEVVPIEAVLEMHGIYPERGKYRLREDDDHASASIHPRKKYGNTIHDFGAGNNFTPLTLTMYLQGCDMKTASQILGEAFNVPPKYTDKDMAENAKKVTDFEWRKIGIYPDMASKNMDFDLERYGVASTAKLAERYRISMSELQQRALGKADAGTADEWDRRRYESILRSRAVPYASEKRDAYFRRMHDDYQFVLAVNSDMDLDKAFAIHKDDYEAAAKELGQMEAALKKAIDGTSVKFRSRRYHPREDFESVLNGEVSFEIGLSSHYEVSESAYRARDKVFYVVVSVDEYYRLLSNGLDTLQVAARQKGEQVSLSFRSSDGVKVNYLVKSLRGKETMLAESLGEALAGAQMDKDVAIKSTGGKEQTK